MSKIRLHNNGKFIKDIDNKVTELNEHIVIVKVEHIKELEKNNIPYSKFIDDFYLVKKGTRKKKFNKEQIKEIKKDLEIGLSIRKCADKYKCSSSIIQSIKKDKY